MIAETFQPMQNFKPELESVIKESLAIEGEVELVNSLMSTRVKWSKFFLRVATLIPSEVWFESFKASRVDSGVIQVKIDGRSSSMTLVNQFQQRLQSSGFFSRIEWQGSKNAGEGSIFGFTFVGELATNSANLQ